MPLRLIFENFLRHGIFPKTWKRANVVPVHKKKEKNLKETSRLMSFLPIFSKILEELIYESLYSHLERENFLSIRLPSRQFNNKSVAFHNSFNL